MVSGGFQCVSHVAPSTILEDGSIALDGLRHSLRHSAALLMDEPECTPRKLRTQGQRLVSRSAHRLD